MFNVQIIVCVNEDCLDRLACSGFLYLVFRSMTNFFAEKDSAKCIIFGMFILFNAAFIALA